MGIICAAVHGQALSEEEIQSPNHELTPPPGAKLPVLSGTPEPAQEIQ